MLQQDAKSRYNSTECYGDQSTAGPQITARENVGIRCKELWIFWKRKQSWSVYLNMKSNKICVKPL